MALTLELEPEVESALAAQAARLGVPVERYIAGVLHRQAQNKTGEEMAGTREKRRALIASIQGKYAGKGMAVDELLRECHECDSL